MTKSNMSNIPTLIYLLFSATTFFTAWMFFKASGNSKAVIIVTLLWMAIQAILSLAGFYQVPDSTPPRFIIVIGPGIIFSILLLVTKWGKAFLDTLNLRTLTLMHLIRVPVEITLFFVYSAGLIPVLMTFEGNNFDIISGITAPIIFYLVFILKKLNRTALLIWNFLCICLLINVLGIALLSAQTPFQKFAFDQPNIGVTYFPFIWLPCVVVPIVLIAHLAAIRQLLKSRSKSTICLEPEKFTEAF
jgi:hypothetical protein